jgi:hypothetical protein
VTFLLQAPESGNYKIEIYNLSGERIAVIDGNMAGQGLVWDTRQTALGIYIVRVFTNGQEVGKTKIAITH